jgi:D-alanyl-D-alanine carboxypeptidase
VEPGDELPLGEILYGLMLNSGNDAALAIAESVGEGSVDRFVAWMNELAARLGLSTAHFENPHGLDDDDHLVSAYDMAIVGRALMRQPALARIVAQPTHDYQGPSYRWTFRHRNPLLGVYPGLDGIKTGFDDLAGLCLVATAVRDDRRAIAVVMKSTGFGADAASLLDYAFDGKRLGPTAPAGGPKRSAPGGRLAMLRADTMTGDLGGPRQLMGRLSVPDTNGGRRPS